MSLSIQYTFLTFTSKNNAMKKIGIILLASFVLFGCKDKKEEDVKADVVIELKATYNGNPIEDNTIYTDPLGHRIRVEYLLAYVSNIELVDESGSATVIKDIYLANLLTGNKSISKEIDPKKYAKIKFGIGVPEEDNKENDPSNYPNDHPLSAIGAQGMFWTWNSGYIFIKFEGKADLEGVEGNDLTEPYAFHCGEDFMFENHEFALNDFTANEGTTKKITIEFQVDKFLISPTDTINIEENYLTHTSGNVELAQRFSDIFNQAITVTNQ